MIRFKSFKAMLVALLLSASASAQNGFNVYEQFTFDESVVHGLSNYRDQLDSMVIEIDTVIQEVLWYEGSLQCNHDWCYKPKEYNLYDPSNNIGIEKICRRCLQHITYRRHIRYRLLKKEESEFYQLLKKIQE